MPGCPLSKNAGALLQKCDIKSNIRIVIQHYDNLTAVRCAVAAYGDTKFGGCEETVPEIDGSVLTEVDSDDGGRAQTLSSDGHPRTSGDWTVHWPH